jgi:glutathione S-transferase
MDTLYTMSGTCSLAPNIAAAWVDAPVKVHNLRRGEHRQTEYLAINPQGQVPALRFEDGDVLTEGAAILAWLRAEYGGADFARDTRLGRKEAEALSYMTSEVHATYKPHFAPRSFADSEGAQQEIQRKVYEKLAGHYARMNDHLTANGNTWYLGERSFADAFLYVLERWIESTPLSIGDYPALKAHRAHMEADAGVLKALQRQDMQPEGE